MVSPPASYPSRRTAGRAGRPARPSDEQLAARAGRGGRGGEAALVRLVVRHRARVLGRCAARLGSIHDAWDVSQEVWLRVHRGLPGFRGSARFTTWLYTIVETQCATYAARRRGGILTEHLRCLIEIHERDRQTRPDPAWAPDRNLQAALREVSRQSREVLRLRFEEDRSLEEIAHLLGIGLSAAKMRLYRGLDQVRARYLDLAGGPPAFT